MASAIWLGTDLATGLGRVSSAICRYVPLSRQFITQSGRVYCVTERGEVSREAWHIWEEWASFNGVREWREITDCYGVTMYQTRRRCHP